MPLKLARARFIVYPPNSTRNNLTKQNILRECYVSNRLPEGHAGRSLESDRTGSKTVGTSMQAFLVDSTTYAWVGTLTGQVDARGRTLQGEYGKTALYTNFLATNILYMSVHSMYTQTRNTYF